LEKEARNAAPPLPAAVDCRGKDALLCNHGGQARAYGAFIRGSFAPG
jgi:hypothetical protein